MNRQATDRLEPKLWRGKLRDLLYDCAAAAPAEQAGLIREAHALFWLGARHDGLSAEPAPDLKQVDDLLALGAYESAVVALVGGNCAFMLSRGARGNCLASVALPDGSEEMIAEASTLALALLAAYLATLLADVELMPGNRAGTGQNAAMRLN